MSHEVWPTSGQGGADRARGSGDRVGSGRRTDCGSAGARPRLQRHQRDCRGNEYQPNGNPLGDDIGARVSQFQLLSQFDSVQLSWNDHAAGQQHTQLVR
jgi:hypothetical protein